MSRTDPLGTVAQASAMRSAKRRVPIGHMSVRQENQSGADAYYDEEGTETDEYGPNNGYYPVHLVVSGPPVHEKPKANKGAKQDHHNQVVLGFRGCDPISPHARLQQAVITGVEGNQGQDECDARTQVNETRHRSAETILALENASKGREEEVHGAKNKSHINGDDQQDRRADEEHGGPNQCCDKHLARCQTFGSHFGSQLIVSGLGPKTCCLAFQQSLRMRLAHQEGGDQENSTTQDNDQPECPAPS